MCKTTQEICVKYYYYQGFPGGAVVKNPPANAGDIGLISDPGRFHMPVEQLIP